APHSPDFLYCSVQQEGRATLTEAAHKTVDLATLGRARTAAHNALREAVIHAVRQEDRAEAVVAREAGISRTTVRSWLGKTTTKEAS
ncbi:hypothetical protein, partial [Planomonospora parontospora]|uniref:hypothetical protein n=1 Tax=Planomonospora parontospora TaxID=58119 RepID=UPI00195006E1